MGLSSSEEGEIFTFGFTMGAWLIMDILEEAEFRRAVKKIREIRY